MLHQLSMTEIDAADRPEGAAGKDGAEGERPKFHRRNTAMINQDILETTMNLGLSDDKESELVIKKMVDLVRVLRE